MKNLLLLLAVVAVFFFESPSYSQQSPEESVEALKTQIQKLELIDRDPNTSPEVKKLNQSFLTERRSRLQVVLKARIESMRAYLTNLKGVLTKEESQKVFDAINDMESEAAALTKNSSSGPSATAEPVSVATSENSNPVLRSPAANVSNNSGVVGDASSPLPAPTPLTDCTSDNSYKNAPPLLVDIADRVAEDITRGKNPAEMVNGSFNKMLFYVVADALTVNTDTPVRSIRNLRAYQYLGETARTDKQVGATSSASGTTSAIDKPGFARLLGFAVEKGAILQDIEGSTLTLSTSPYVLYTLNGGDTAENYARAGFLNRIGLSASFNIEDQNAVLASARRNQLNNWSVRARLYGDRSTRSRAFQDAWRLDIQPAIERRLNVLTGVSVFMNDRADEFDVFEAVNDQINTAISTLMSSERYTNASDADKKAMLSNTIQCNIRSGVFDEITSGRSRISDASRNEIVNNFVPALSAALDNLEVVRGVLKDKLDELSKGPLATFAYINHREPAGSDYSEFKFLYEQDKSVFRILKVVGNAAFSIYNKPNPLLNQSRLRDFSAALSFEGAFDSPFLKNQPDLSKVTYAFTGNYQRFRENSGLTGRKPDLAAFQFKLDFPIYAGLSLPLAITYSSGTELSGKEDTRVNFGFKFDMDKLFALTKLLGNP